MGDIKNDKDLAILQTQLKNGVGLFACNDWEVFSDKSVQLSPTITSTVLPNNADYGKFFRMDKPDHFVNTPLFVEAWRKLRPTAGGRPCLGLSRWTRPLSSCRGTSALPCPPRWTPRQVSTSRTAQASWRVS